MGCIFEASQATQWQQAKREGLPRQESRVSICSVSAWSIQSPELLQLIICLCEYSDLLKDCPTNRANLPEADRWEESGRLWLKCSFGSRASSHGLFLDDLLYTQQ